jgi:hypothetical protein
MEKDVFYNIYKDEIFNSRPNPRWAETPSVQMRRLGTDGSFVHPTPWMEMDSANKYLKSQKESLSAGKTELWFVNLRFDRRDRTRGPQDISAAVVLDGNDRGDSDKLIEKAVVNSFIKTFKTNEVGEVCVGGNPFITPTPKELLEFKVLQDYMQRECAKSLAKTEGLIRPAEKAMEQIHKTESQILEEKERVRTRVLDRYSPNRGNSNNNSGRKE